jgi:hypothetical protein
MLNNLEKELLSYILITYGTGVFQSNIAQGTHMAYKYGETPRRTIPDLANAGYLRKVSVRDSVFEHYRLTDKAMEELNNDEPTRT